MADADRYSLRDQLIDRVQTGDLTPEQAEREAERLGCDPLSYEPPPSEFNPKGEEFWTLPMAVAWIAYRTPTAVRDWWDGYRAECLDWLFRESRAGRGEPVRGYWLEQRSNATLARLKLAEAAEDRSDRDPEWSMTVSEAIEALHIALRGACFAATGHSMASGIRQEIPAMLWQDLDFMQDFAMDAVQARDSGTGAVFTNVTVQRGAVTMFWPARRERLVPSLPPLMRPEGPGYMPLYCAAQWVASKGGAHDFDPEDSDIWRPAYAALIDAISGGEVAISGVARGARETIDGVVFAGCAVSYPFETTSLELMFSGDFHLRSYPYLDEDSWRGGYDDAFENRWQKRWTQLMVRKADVARLWSFEALAQPPGADAIRAQYKSGAPGQPSSMHLVEAEFAARAARGEVAETLAQEADALAAWREKVHPHAPSLTAKTIRNRLRERFNELRRAR